MYVCSGLLIDIFSAIHDSQSQNFVSEEILRMEPDEGLEKLQVAFRVCGKYRESYEDRKAHLAEYFKEQPVVEWNFEPSLVFARMDRLTSQMKMIEVRERGRS